jgi:L-histidine N-alpha-methyltransferase
MRPAADAFGSRLDIREILSLGQPSLAADVASAWGGNPKRCLPPKYFYDERGSTLFDAITQLPEYYLTRAETEILTVNGRQIISAFGGPLHLLELGSGSALKTRLLIDAVLRSQNTLHFSAIDVSREALRTSSIELIDTFPSLLIRAYIGDYFDVLDSGVLQFEHSHKVLALCLGSNIGNYCAADAQRLMAGLSMLLRPGDGMLLGIDMKKDHDTLQRAYDDDGGLMREFSTNLLIRMNRELGANFNPIDFDLTVICNEKRGTVESFLRSRRTHDVTMVNDSVTVHFDKNELVPTESSFKYGTIDVARLAERNRFKITNIWHDRAGTFASYLLVRESNRAAKVIDMPTRHLKIKPT